MKERHDKTRVKETEKWVKEEDNDTIMKYDSIYNEKKQLYKLE